MRVGRWQRFEIFIENDTPYADPYRDATLDVTYERPDGSTVAFWGFYDGGRTWRARFMPDQLGTWAYSATFSDGAPGTSGTFACVASDVPGMLSVDESNPVWFGFRGGAHLLVRSLHVGDRFFADNYPDAKRKAFLDWAQAQGYNLLSIASHYLNRPEPGRGEGWDTPALWPLDAAAYRRVERILDDLAERHLMVFPFAGFFGRAAHHPTDPLEQERYLRYTLARFGSYWNILLNVAGPEPLLRKRSTMSRPEIVRLGQLVQSLDVYGHPLSVHNRTGDDEFVDEPWTSYGVLQGPKTTDLDELSAGLLANHHPSKPLYAQETLWSGNQHGHPDYSDGELRKNAYVIHMSAAALNFSDNGGPRTEDIGNSSSGFSGSLDLGDTRQWRHDIVKRVWDVLETFPFHAMRPRQDLVSAGYCLAQEGQQYLVYLPLGGAVDVNIDGGPYAASWINAQDGTDRRTGTPTSTGVGLVSPSDGEDWLLYLAPAEHRTTDPAMGLQRRSAPRVLVRRTRQALPDASTHQR